MTTSKGSHEKGAGKAHMLPTICRSCCRWSKVASIDKRLLPQIRERHAPAHTDSILKNHRTQAYAYRPEPPLDLLLVQPAPHGTNVFLIAILLTRRSSSFYYSPPAIESFAKLFPQSTLSSFCCCYFTTLSNLST